MPAKAPRAVAPDETPGMEGAHTLQRRWPFVRFLRPLNDNLECPVTLALQPASNLDSLGIQIDIRFMKQGTYHTKPATLLVIEVLQNLPKDTSTTAFELRLDSVGVSKRYKGVQPEPAYIGAMGPSRIEELPPTELEGFPVERLLTVTMHETREGAVGVVQVQKPNWRGLPRYNMFAFVVVHPTPIRLLALPSSVGSTGSQRLSVFRRTKISPCYLDHASESSRDVVTCLRHRHGECHTTCTEFGADHMTPEVWKGLLDVTRRHKYDGEPPNNGWVKYLSPA